jgi:hypothetical protein
VEIIETPVFTKKVAGVLGDDELHQLQLALILRPEQGELIPGGAGLRKVRWRSRGTGKRGGLRILYYWDMAAETIFMIYAFEKKKQADLSRAQLSALARMIRKELR